MKLSDRNTRLALMKMFTDLLTDALADERAEHLELLVDRYDEEGTPSFDVKVTGLDGDRVKVARISLAIPKDRIDVTDEAALIEWAKANGPTLIDTERIPAQPSEWVPGHWTTEIPERVEHHLDKSALDGFIKAMKPGPSGTVVDPSTGTLVDGLTHIPGAAPKSFSVRFDTDGRDTLLAAYRRGDLDELLDATPLPTLGGQGA